MPKTKKKIYYWDACVFLALLNIDNEPITELEKNGLLSISREIDDNEAMLITSMITFKSDEVSTNKWKIFFNKK